MGVLGEKLSPLTLQQCWEGGRVGARGGEGPEIREATAPPSETICSHLPRALGLSQLVLLSG